MRTLRLPVLACLLAVHLVWGTTYFAISVALEGFAPLFQMAIRFPRRRGPADDLPAPARGRCQRPASGATAVPSGPCCWAAEWAAWPPPSSG